MAVLYPPAAVAGALSIPVPPCYMLPFTSRAGTAAFAVPDPGHQEARDEAWVPSAAGRPAAARAGPQRGRPAQGQADHRARRARAHARSPHALRTRRDPRLYLHVRLVPAPMR